MEKRTVFEVAPSKEFNRNSEGDFVYLSDGRILFAWSRYGSEGNADWCGADIFAVISSDNGNSFGEPFLLLSKKIVDAENIMSVSFMKVSDGIIMFFLAKHHLTSCILYSVKTTDDFKSFEAPVRCIPEEGYFTVNNNRVIKLSNGRLLFAASKLDIKLVNGALDASDGDVYVYGSDDEGKTWKCISGTIHLPLTVEGEKDGACAMEPGLCELSDGRIWCYIRTILGRQYECFSADGGVTFSIPNPSRFSSAISPMSTLKLSSGKIIAVWNPEPLYCWRDTEWGLTGGRDPLVYSILEPDGSGFVRFPTVIEHDKKCGFSYCSIFEKTDGKLLLGYCAGSVADGHHLNRIRVTELSL